MIEKWKNLSAFGVVHEEIYNISLENVVSFIMKAYMIWTLIICVAIRACIEKEQAKVEDLMGLIGVISTPS